MYCLLVTGFFLIPDISFRIISEKNHLTAFFDTPFTSRNGLLFLENWTAKIEKYSRSNMFISL